MELRELAARIPGNPLGRVAEGAFLLRTLNDAGVIQPVRPDKAARMVATYARWGNNRATASALAAIRNTDQT